MVALVVALALFIGYKAGAFGHYDIGSALLGNLHWFLVGIASRLSWSVAIRIDVDPMWICCGAALIAIGVGGEFLPLLIWACFFAFMVWRDLNSTLGRIFSIATTWPPILLFGEASYSMYLIHRPLQILFGKVALDFWQVDQFGMLISQALAIAAALPMSIIMYRLIERPGMALGKRLARCTVHS